MRSEEKLLRNAETSEKAIEKHLCRRVKERGGKALKFASATQTGYPDRVCLFPGGHTVWVELKGEGGRLTRLQATRISELRRMGHMAAVCGSIEDVERLLKLVAVPVLAKVEYTGLAAATPQDKTQGTEPPTTGNGQHLTRNGDEVQGA